MPPSHEPAQAPEAQSLLTGIGAAAADSPDAVATEAFGRPWTWAQLAERIARMTAVLSETGVGPGSRVGLMLPPCPTAAVASIAALRLGASVQPCSPLLLGGTLREELETLEDGVLVTIDLLGIQDRWLPLLPELDLSAVLIERMAELLPFPKNWILPMMRGSQIAAQPVSQKAKSLAALLRRAETAAPAPGAIASAGIVETDGPELSLEAVASAGRRLVAEAEAGSERAEPGWFYAHAPSSAWALTALLAPLAIGRRVSIGARLHPKSICQDIAGKRPAVAVFSPPLAEELARSPASLSEAGGATLKRVVLSPACDPVVVEVLRAEGLKSGYDVLVWDGLPA